MLISATSHWNASQESEELSRQQVFDKTHIPIASLLELVRPAENPLNPPVPVTSEEWAAAERAVMKRPRQKRPASLPKERRK